MDDLKSEIEKSLKLPKDYAIARLYTICELVSGKSLSDTKVTFFDLRKLKKGEK